MTAPEADAAKVPASRFGVFGLADIVVGFLVALWVSLGRIPFGVAGGLTPLFVPTLGFAIGALHFFAGRAIMRTARLGRTTRPATILMVCFSWACGILLGLMIPDITDLGWQTILTGGEEPGLGIAIGISNPLGIICIGTAVVAVVLARQDTRERLNPDDEDE